MDWNNDGRLDIVTGENSGHIRVYLNNGSGLSNYARIRVGPNEYKVPGGFSKPDVVDWNGDGKKDLIVGDGNGNVFFLRNTGTDAAPAFTSAASVVAGGRPLSVGAGGRASPVVVDWNKDGKKDLIVGETYGKLFYYENSGTDANPVLPGTAQTLRSSSGVINVGYYSRPEICDWNNDGATDLVVGNDEGQVYLFLGRQPMLSISDVSVTEGNAGTTDAVFTVTLSQAVAATVTVNYATADGLAKAGTDYVATSGTLSFAPGEKTKTIAVPVNGDLDFEPDETFIVALSNATGDASISDGQGTGTIRQDGDVPLPRLTIGDAGGLEDGSGVDAFRFMVSLSEASDNTVTVPYATQGRSAIEGVDYTGQIGVVNFAPGQTQAFINLAAQISEDTLDEPAETFAVVLSGANNALIQDAEAIGTIQDNDPAPALSIADVTIGEAGGTAVMQVSLSQVSGFDVTAQFATAGGTAGAGDFEGQSGSITIPAGQSSATISIGIIDDASDEPEESFKVVLSAPTNATIVDAEGTCAIQDDDAPPGISIADAAGAEPASGAGQIAFDVTLSAPSAYTVTLNYATRDGSATAGQDYTFVSGQITFAPGETTKQVTVPLLGDSAKETAESFTVYLANPNKATLSDAEAQGTIRDDDVPALTLGNVSVAETAGAEVKLPVTLSEAGLSPISVNYEVIGGTATVGADVAAASGVLTLEAGATSGWLVLPASILGDALYEGNETCFVRLTQPTNVALGNDQATVTIQDNDSAPTLTIGDATVAEGNSGTRALSFTVTLSSTCGLPVSASYSMGGGTATAGKDYIACSGTVTFESGETSKVVTLPACIKGDALDEPNETMLVNLSDATNATIADGQAKVTIRDDDVGLPEVRVYVASGKKKIEILDGQKALVSFGSVLVNSAAPTKTFYIYNVGTATLTTSRLVVPKGFVVLDGLAKSISPGRYDTVVIQLPTKSAGSRAGAVSFTNNDRNETPFNFNISGLISLKKARR